MGDITLSVLTGTVSESTVPLTPESSLINLAETKQDFGMDRSTSGDIKTIRTMIVQTYSGKSLTEAWPTNTESTIVYSSYKGDMSESSLFLMQHATQELPANTGHVVVLESSQYSTVLWSNHSQTLESQSLPSSVILNHDNGTGLNTVTVQMDNLPKSISELEPSSSGVMSQTYIKPLLANSDNLNNIKVTPSVSKLDNLLSTGYLFNSSEQESTYKTNVPIVYLPTISSSHAHSDNVSFTDSAQTFQAVPLHVSDTLDLPPLSSLDYAITAKARYSTYMPTEASLIFVNSAQLNSTVAPYLPMTLKPTESSTNGDSTILGGRLSNYYLFVGLPLCGVAVLVFLILCVICIRRCKTRSNGSPAKHHAPDLWVHSQGEVPLITKDSVPEANEGEALMVQRDLADQKHVHSNLRKRMVKQHVLYGEQMSTRDTINVQELLQEQERFDGNTDLHESSKHVDDAKTVKGCATYEAVFNFDGEQSSHLSFKEGDQIKVHRKEANGWWQGTVQDQTGWFPNDCVQAANYDEVVMENEVKTPNDTQISSFMIKRCDMPMNTPTYPTEDDIKAEHTYCKVSQKHKPEISECSSSSSSCTKSESCVQGVPQPFLSTSPDLLTKFMALYSHTANSTGQLSMNKGDVILCSDHDLKGWTHGYNEATQTEGWVPSSYIEKMIDQSSTNCMPSPVSVFSITKSSSESFVPADNVPAEAAVPLRDPSASDTQSKASTPSAQQPQPKSKLKPSRIAPVPPSKVTSTVESKIPTLFNRTPKLDRPIVSPPLPPSLNVKHPDDTAHNKDNKQNENQHTNPTMIVNDTKKSEDGLQDLNQQPDNFDSLSALVFQKDTAKSSVPNRYIKPKLVSIPRHETKMADVESGNSDHAKYRPPPPKPMTPKLGPIRVKLRAPESLDEQEQSRSEDETVFQVIPQRKFASLVKQESEPESPVAVCRDLSSFGSTFGKHQDHPAELLNDDDVDFNIPIKAAGSDSKNLVESPANIVNRDGEISKIENTDKAEKQTNEKDIGVNSNEIVSNISASSVKSSKLQPPRSVTTKLSAISIIPTDIVSSGSVLLVADLSDKPSKLPRSHMDSGSKYPLSKVDGLQTQTNDGKLKCASEPADAPKKEHNPDEINVSNVKEISRELAKNVDNHSDDMDSVPATGDMGKPHIAPKPKSGLPKLQLKLKTDAQTRKTDVDSPNAESNTFVHSPCLTLSLASEKTETIHELDGKSDFDKSEVSKIPMGSAIMLQPPKHFGRKSQIPGNQMKNKSTNKLDYSRTNNDKLSENDSNLLMSSNTNLKNNMAESPNFSKIPPPKPVNAFVQQRSNSPANRTGIPLSMRNHSSSPSLSVATGTPAVQAENPVSETNNTVVKTTNIPSGLVSPKKIMIEQEESSRHPFSSSDILSGQNVDGLDAEHPKLDRPSKLPKVHKGQSMEGKPLQHGKSLLPVVHKMLDTGVGSSNGVDQGNTTTKLESAIPVAKQSRSQLMQQTVSTANNDNR